MQTDGAGMGNGGEHFNILWAAVGAGLTLLGFLVKKLPGFLIEKWTCHVKRVKEIEEKVIEIQKQTSIQDVDIEHLKTQIIEDRADMRRLHERIDSILKG